MIITIFTSVIVIEKYYSAKKLALKATQESFSLYSKKIAERSLSFDQINESILIPLSHAINIHLMPERDQKHLYLEGYIELLKANKDLYAIDMGDKFGNFYLLINLKIHRSLTDSNSEPSAKYLEERTYRQGSDITRYQYFLDEKLNIIKTAEIKTNFDPRVRNWYITGLKHKKVIKTPPFAFANLSSQGISYVKQVKNSGSVLSLDYAISTISDNLKDQNLGSEISSFIFNQDKELISRLNEQKDSVLVERKIALKKEQRAYLDGLESIVIGNELDWVPFDYAISGVPKGYSVDLIRLLAQKVDMNIRFINGYSWPELVALYDNGTIDVLHSILSKKYRTEDNYFSKHFYIKTTPQLIIRKNSPYSTLAEIEKNNKSVSNALGYFYSHDYIKSNYPAITIIEASSPTAALEMVATGEVAANIEIDKVYQHISSNHQLTNLQATALTNQNISDNSMAGLHYISKKKILIEILDQAYASLTSREVDFLENKWFPQGDHNFYLSHSNIIPSVEILTIAKQNLNTVSTIAIAGINYFLFTAVMETGNYLAVMTKEDDAMAPYMAEIQESFITSVILLLLLLPIVWYVSTLIVKPILALENQSNIIKNLDYDQVQLIDSSIDELHQLSISMLTMSEKMNNHQKQQDTLLNAFIQLMAEAIDEKSVYTGNHCHRVPILTLMITEAAKESQNEAFKDFDLKTKEEQRELEIAAWLHDCGKVTTPEYVVDKAVKLETIYNRIHEIRARCEIIHRDLQITAYQKIIHGQDETLVNQQLKIQQDELFEQFAFIAKCNIGGEFMHDDDIAQLDRIGARSWLRYFDDSLGLSKAERLRYTDIKQAPHQETLLSNKKQHLIKRTIDRTKEYEEQGFKVKIPKYLYNLGELYNLRIKKGTLTAEERFKINAHMIVTIKMLNKLPLPDELKKVPEYAGGHHETLIGTGYPKKLTKAQMSIPARIMAVADIFEALTASDRPYKNAKTLSESLTIMRVMVKKQHIDGDIFTLFLESGVYLEYAKKFLQPEQIDAIDIDKYIDCEIANATDL
ncbi:MAG: transporter substrate-binding domain-containing protein [Psychrobium sp.]|nr:transporter substrate-binding domain-containing protein [Psychrobium sp.]